MGSLVVVTEGILPEVTGGISTSVQNEVLEIMRRGHHVFVVTRRRAEDRPIREDDGLYHVRRYPGPREGSLLYQAHPLWTGAQLPKVLRDISKETEISALYVHNVFQAKAVARSDPRYRFVYNYHAPAARDLYEDVLGGRYGWKSRLASFASQTVKNAEHAGLVRADAVVVHSQFVREELFSEHPDVSPEKVVNVPLCADGDRFGFSPDPNSARESLDLPRDRTILVCIRRLVHRVGLPNLISAMGTVRKARPDVLLLIGGHGYLKPDLQHMIESLELAEHVRLLGFVSEENLPRLYQAADLSILPTTQLEGFGMVTIESWSCGTPVVATPVGANVELLTPLDRRYLSEGTAPEQLARAIVSVLPVAATSEARRKCRDHFERNYSQAKVVDQLQLILGLNEKQPIP